MVVVMRSVHACMLFACLLLAVACAKPAAETITPSMRNSQGIIGLKPAAESPERALDGWTVVGDLRGLAQHVDQAAEKGTPIIVHITAKWCTDCLVLEKDVLGSEKVAVQLAAMSRLLVDVTSVSDESQQLLAIFGVKGLPAILFYDDVVPLAGYLLAPQKVERPEATAAILEPVAADELLRRLRKSP